MAYSKVILNGTTLMDVTQKTVEEDKMLSGYTALKNDGTSITGTYEPPTGGGQLYIFTDCPYQHEFISINSVSQTPRTSYSSQALVEGVTINFNTYNHWILDTITGVTSGNSYPFTTISATSYTFTMPGESVYCDLIYND